MTKDSLHFLGKSSLLKPSFAKHDLSNDIEHDRFIRIYQECPQHLIGGLIAASILFIVFFDSASPQQLFIWAVLNTLLLLTSALFYILYRHYKSHLTQKLWSKMPALILFCWGLVWSLPAHLFLANVEPSYVFFLTIILVALCATPAITLSLYPSAYLAFIIPILSGLQIFLMQYEFGMGEIRYFLVPVFLLCLLFYSRNLHNTLIDSIRLRLEREQAFQEVKRVNDSKSKFFAVASHDIRQPLQAIHFFASALSNETLSKESRALLSKLQTSTDSMSELLDSLLDMSRLEKLTDRINIKHIALKPIVDKLITQLQPEADHKDLLIYARDYDHIIITDSILLERILRNLLLNAIRYTDSGEVVLSSKIIHNSERYFVAISIQDTGCGIPDSEKKAIFAEFHQLHNPERDRQKGLGLGLSIVKRLTERLDHSLAFTSQIKNTETPDKIDHGSCFTLQIPLGDKALVKDNNSSRLPWLLTDLKVLVIDDQRDIRESLSQVLKTWGCDTHNAESLEEALSLLNLGTWLPQFIIADYRLRDNKTGIEAIEKIAAFMGATVPCLIMSGDTEPHIEKQVQTRNLLLIHKPVKPLQLRATIQQALRMQSPG